MSSALVALLAANSVPLIGAIFLDWSVFEIFALYWSENVVLGGYALLRIVTAANTGLAGRIGSALFFTAHFGLFCFVHAAFVVGAHR